MSQDYNATIHLPKTDFPMRASLPAREPAWLEDFDKADIYSKVMKKNEGKPNFILHDGPPYANGNIHIGTAMNKVLKDFIVKYKNMTGYCAPYVPGWDTHGLPIESAILKKSKLKRNEMSAVEFRDKCKEFALDFVDTQRTSFKRLGVMGDWNNPYITLAPEFEAQQIRIFGAMAKKGYIYKGLKPVYWCPTDETALAEAEIEYQDDPCTSIYVKFKVKEDKDVLCKYGDVDKMYFVIWTTTPWTLPGNLAICLNADFDYSLLQLENGDIYIVASELVEMVAKEISLEKYTEIGKLKGADMEYIKAEHPFMDRSSLIICGEHVTLDAGTGCVHTAPGFGVDDFNICKKYPEIGMTVPVNSRGVMTEEAGPYAGQYYASANDVIVEDIKKSGALVATKNFVHSYPHCWRCKKPIIFRATEQWFASVDAIKEQAIKACEDIKWNPEWGKERMISMIRERADWCISRQRSWGVPIPIFYCEKCGKEYITEETINAVANLFEKEGSNAWFAHSAEEILPTGSVCHCCGHNHFTKESDIMDVWFDSGSSHAGVLDVRSNLSFPADVYLEGGDQFRGWFQSSLLTSIAAKGVAPYKQVVSHGWTVDGEGKAMHKSLGNAVAPEDIIKDYGADILRLWVASADYRQDMRVSKDILKQLSDMYLKIRNTARYILGNLADFDPDDCLTYSEMFEIDQWAINRLNRLIGTVRSAYERYEYHTISHGIHNFCTVDMSNFYLDIIKDRLYCDATDSVSRRSAQSAIYMILDGLVRLIAPILSFTAQEIWANMPHDKNANPEHVLLNDIPQVNTNYEFPEEKESKWADIRALRTDVNKALELSRAQKIVGKPLDADIELYFDKQGYEKYQQINSENFKDIFIVSNVETKCKSGEGYTGIEFAGVTVKVKQATSPKCIRCWAHSKDVGLDAEHPELCPRCAKAVRQ